MRNCPRETFTHVPPKSYKNFTAVLFVVGGAWKNPSALHQGKAKGYVLFRNMYRMSKSKRPCMSIISFEFKMLVAPGRGSGP